MIHIDELIDDFQRHGGIYKNVALGHRKSSGYYLYSLDKTQESVVSCPANLLVNISDIGVNEDGLFIATPDNYKNNIDFLERYFSFHFNKKMIDDYIVKMRQIQSLSSKDLSIISKVFMPRSYSTGNHEKLNYAKIQILKSHHIEYYGENLIMPFVTFLNFSTGGRPYDVNKNAITVSGKFSGEVFVEYNYCDTLMIAVQHGFVTDSRFSYSIHLSFITPNGLKVIINRNLAESNATSEGHPSPTVQKNRGTITISWFPLRIENHPLYIKKISQAIAMEIGMPADNLFHGILQTNKNILLLATSELNKSRNLFAQMLAAAMEKQLTHITKARL